MNILKPAKHFIIKGGFSSRLGQCNIRPFTARQTEAVDEVSGLDLALLDCKFKTSLLQSV